MRFRLLEEEETRLGIAPLIDVVFLLLIFFMLTSHFDVATGIRIQLPKVAQKIYGADESKITLIIDAAGEVYFEGKKLELEALHARIIDLVQQKDLSQVVLQADKEVRHGRVVEIMDMVKRAGVRVIMIAARWDAEKVY
jgi:biopolymer transport protein ExbD